MYYWTEDERAALVAGCSVLHRGFRYEVCGVDEDGDPLVREHGSSFEPTPMRLHALDPRNVQAPTEKKS